MFNRSSSDKCEVVVSFVEVHNEKLYDLLSNKHRIRLTNKSDVNVLEEMTSKVRVHSISEALKCITNGNSSRVSSRKPAASSSHLLQAR